VGPDRNDKNAPDHKVIEHFGTDDVLKDSYLLRSALPCAYPPALPFNSGQPQIIVADDRVGLFVPACRMWVELSPAGEVLGQWKWKSRGVDAHGHDLGGIRSVALTSSNQLYARLDSPKEISLVRFDRQASEWVPVSTAAVASAGAHFAWLEGSDGEALVYLASGKTVAWSTPVPATH